MKDGDAWIWRTLFNEVTVRVVTITVINADSERQLSIHAKNELSRGQMLTLIPKYVIEDLYKELVLTETITLENEIARLTAIVDATPVEMSEDEDESR